MGRGRKPKVRVEEPTVLSPEILEIIAEVKKESKNTYK